MSPRHRRDPKRPDEWPVDQYPYVLQIQHGDPSYHATLGEAQRKAVGLLEKLALQFKALDSRVVENCAAAAQEVRRLGEAGGNVGHLIDPHTGVWFRCHIHRREKL